MEIILVLFSSSCSFISPHRHFTTSSVNETTCSIINPAPNTLESSKSSPPPVTEKPIKSNDSPSTSPSVTASFPNKPSSPSSVSTSNHPSDSSSAGDPKTNTDKCSTGSLGETGVKLPSKDQVESFFFKSLVYLWDFAYYVFCLCRKLVETYVFNNSTVQQYWKQMLKRMDDARKEIKTK
ncbi:uncharacterized protein LOC135955525 [Calliphora vicina]|uniref:uncharacterized protein LOC135955525 n=1 Tax=Calliphora vicina TaxID=7373 RepID=UPI00325B8716